MNPIRSLFARLVALFTPAPKLLTPSWLGIVLPPYIEPLDDEEPHPAPPDDLGRLKALHAKGRAPLVRFQNTGSSQDMMRILTVLARGYSVLSCLPYKRGYGPIARGMAIQLGDAVDAQEPAVNPYEYGQTFQATMASMRLSVPRTIPIVTASFAAASRGWIARALVAGAADADAICVQVVGEDLTHTFRRDLLTLNDARNDAACLHKPIWITAVRCTHPEAGVRDAQLRAFLALPELRQWVERCYVDTDGADAPVTEAMRAEIRRP